MKIGVIFVVELLRENFASILLEVCTKFSCQERKRERTEEINYPRLIYINFLFYFICLERLVDASNQDQL